MNEARAKFVSSSAEQWGNLVRLVLDGENPERLAVETKQNIQVLKRKFQAVKHAWESGCSAEAIILSGQNTILSLYAKSKRNGDEPQRILRWRISKGLADAIQSEDPSKDAEEPLVNRIARLLHIETSEELWEFFHSVFADWPDEMILNYGSELVEKKKRRH